MNRRDLEHLIRSASKVTDSYEVVIIGSQSIHGQFPAAPSTLMMSDEADMFVENNEKASDAIDGSLGEGSPFHATHGFYAQGVGVETASLPAGWMDRLVTIQNENTDLRMGKCLHPTDLAAAKLAAGREKDWPFVAEMLYHRMTNAGDLAAALRTIPTDKLTPERVAFLCRWVTSQAAEHVQWQAEAQTRLENVTRAVDDGGMEHAIATALKGQSMPSEISLFDATSMHQALLEQAIADGRKAANAGRDLLNFSPWAVRPLEREIIQNMIDVMVRPHLGGS